MFVMGSIIINCVNNEKNFFANLTCWRLVADEILTAMDQQVVGLQGSDIQAIRVLYKFFLKAIISSDQFFDKFVDRREFLNQLVLRPLIQIGR